jgi:hypothetical protein
VFDPINKYLSSGTELFGVHVVIYWENGDGGELYTKPISTFELYVDGVKAKQTYVPDVINAATGQHIFPDGSETISPGAVPEFETVTGYVYFEIPKGWKKIELAYDTKDVIEPYYAKLNPRIE